MKGTWITIISVILAAIVIGGLFKIAFALVTNVWFWVGLIAIALTHCAIKVDERSTKNCKKKR